MAATTLYGFFRSLDDLVDGCETREHRAVAHAELNAWRAWLREDMLGAGAARTIAGDLAQVITTHGVPMSVLAQLLDGLESDLTRQQSSTSRNCNLYCYQVASTVGVAMAHVLDAAQPAALAAAETLAAAMQLTNILRDVGEDLDLGRVYLPRTVLAAHALSVAELRAMRAAQRGPDERFTALMRAEVARADALYEIGLAGVTLLPRDCQLPILVAGRLYRRLLRLIERVEYDTLRRRVATSRVDKAREAVICLALLGFGRLQPARQPVEQHAAAIRQERA